MLFDLVTWRRQSEEREFHFGPLLSVASSSGGRRIALGNGLVSFRRDAQGWRTFWFDFSSKTADSSMPNR